MENLKKELVIYTLDEVATILKVKKRAVYGYIKNGDLKAIKISGGLKVREIDLEEYINNAESVNVEK